MQIGERIQKHRKGLCLSQEELGKKLLVSRQTISLWEKGQTVPTIDNLIRLSEIFDVPVDEILGSKRKEQEADKQLNESYRFSFSKEELNEIGRLQRKRFYKKPVIITLIFIYQLVILIGTSAFSGIIGFMIGVFLFGIISLLRRIISYNRTWKNSAQRIYESTYEYLFFEHYFQINTYCNNEIIRISKCHYADIEQIQQFDKWLYLQFDGQTFIIRKNELKENSVLYSYMYRNPSKTAEVPVPGIWRTVSVILFIASILSILGALALVGAVTSINGQFLDNMWMFFLLTPIPISSIVVGFVYKYKKNIIVGIIMTAFLCLYGSFVFMF